jgi:hypothetical protein
MAPAGSSGPTRRPQTSNPDRQALRLVGLAVLTHMLRSRRFQERAAVAAIVLAALAGLRQENQAKALAALAAWNKRQADRLEREVGRQIRQAKRKAKGALT